MKLWRICNATFITDPLDGKCAARHALNRWNPKGVPVVYTATHQALAVLELLVHLSGVMPSHPYRLYELDLPDELEVTHRSVDTLPSGWASHRSLKKSQVMGAAWVKEGKTVAMLVPSVPMPSSRNAILNPAHPEFHRIKVVSQTRFRFDQRLFPAG